MTLLGNWLQAQVKDQLSEAREEIDHVNKRYTMLETTRRLGYCPAGDDVTLICQEFAHRHGISLVH